MAPVSGFQGILAILAVFVAAGGLAIYRLFLSPLARFPGPKLAALTGWYEVYFDCFKRGRFWVEIEEMHKKYGIFPAPLSGRPAHDEKAQLCASVRGNCTWMIQTGTNRSR